MACPLVRKRTSVKKDSEMASSRFLTKRYKVEIEPVHMEVRTTLKGHRPLLCVDDFYNTFERNMQLLKGHLKR